MGGVKALPLRLKNEPLAHRVDRVVRWSLGIAELHRLMERGASRTRVVDVRNDDRAATASNGSARELPFEGRRRLRGQRNAFTDVVDHLSLSISAAAAVTNVRPAKRSGTRRERKEARSRMNPDRASISRRLVLLELDYEHFPAIALEQAAPNAAAPSLRLAQRISAEC